MVVGVCQQQEKNLLRLSFVAAGVFVILAFGFAILSDSGAILFDGIYSLIAFFMALLTLKVSDLVDLPDDDRFHFGYTAIEPTLNLFKALIIIVGCLYAVVSSISALMAGGTEAEYGVGIIYGVVATVSCLGISLFMRLKGSHIRSDLVAVDSHTWLVDGVLSASILLGFLIAYFFERNGLSHWSPFVDPVLLVGLGIAMLPVPVKIMLERLNEVIHKAPPEKVTKAIEKRLTHTLTDVPYRHVEVRISKAGRNIYLLVHIIVAPSFSVKTIAELDTIRKRCEEEMQAWEPAIVMDILFVSDPKLAD
ncbi:cation diffusion facilitator family transporter [Alteromonas sediminis]|uniref:Cation diffusion facilitator family transporter n=1 Tax=Alteromonas sediminis TaxID=2259342 RepID=A0A3N5ZDB3_9ALTE|nr:cation diffusion facilitator family transporter [Alteromonas sediminis]RPJ67998.1 cation diffusion facilitator family transporter [Alteromonas sediminis]